MLTYVGDVDGVGVRFLADGVDDLMGMEPAVALVAGDGPLHIRDLVDPFLMLVLVDEGQELLILVTELTINEYSARFISRYGCQEYFAHNKELLFYERQKEIIRETEALELN
jgi:hypothetical protein